MASFDSASRSDVFLPQTADELAVFEQAQRLSWLKLKTMMDAALSEGVDPRRITNRLEHRANDDAATRSIVHFMMACSSFAQRIPEVIDMDGISLPRTRFAGWNVLVSGPDLGMMTTGDMPGPHSVAGFFERFLDTEDWKKACAENMQAPLSLTTRTCVAPSHNVVRSARTRQKPKPLAGSDKVLH